MDLSDLRTDYEAVGIDPADMLDDPLEQFNEWLEAAIEAGDREPQAMVLSTVDADGRPRGRNVLLRATDDRGFVFFTNYTSIKAEALDATGWASLTFHWYLGHRQVIVEGAVERITADESDAYFAKRPRGSQLGAWASDQSSVLASRDELAESLAEITARFDGQDVPRPPFWGGYRVVPDLVEFWQGQPSRLHDRVRYLTGDSGWVRDRLSP